MENLGLRQRISRISSHTQVYVLFMIICACLRWDSPLAW